MNDDKFHTLLKGKPNIILPCEPPWGADDQAYLGARTHGGVYLSLVPKNGRQISVKVKCPLALKRLKIYEKSFLKLSSHRCGQSC
jgi:hypothetical protein